MGEEFIFMKNCLKDFHYPNIDYSDDAAIAEIFSNCNRQFLISWIFNQIDDDYTSITNNANKGQLAELIFYHGFCTEVESRQFMNGECEIVKQFQIFNKIFKFMKSIKCDQHTALTPLLNEELQLCLNFDTNLFPEYGPKCVLNTEERDKKMKQYKKEIVELTNILKQNESNEGKLLPLLEGNLKEYILTIMKQLQQNEPDLNRKILYLKEIKNPVEKNKEVKFKTDFAATIDKCTKEQKVVLELFQNTNVIEDFEETMSVNHCYKKNPKIDLVKELFDVTKTNEKL